MLDITIRDGGDGERTGLGPCVCGDLACACKDRATRDAVPFSRDDVSWRRGSDPDRLESRKPPRGQGVMGHPKVCIVTYGAGGSGGLAVDALIA